MGRVKSAIYARMEEMSFRSGVGLAAGVLVAAGLAIALPVTLNGHSAAATGAPRPSAVARVSIGRVPMADNAAAEPAMNRRRSNESLQPC